MRRGSHLMRLWRRWVPVWTGGYRLQFQHVGTMWEQYFRRETPTPCRHCATKASNEQEQQSQQQQQDQEEWIHLPSGLKYRDLVGGGGDRSPEPGELVKVHYSALILETDTLYESTYQSQYPFEFRLNDGSAIRGINEGVASMREGGRRLIYVLPHLGYGRFSKPPNITLLIELELVQIGPDRTVWQKLRSLFS